MPAPAQDAHLAGLRARLELELDVAVERRHVDRCAERGLRHRQVDRREQVVALADEARVGPDVDEHVEVAGAAAGLAGVALAADADPLAVVDPRRDLDRRASAPRRRGRRRRRSRTGARRSGRRRRSGGRAARG